MLDLVAYGFVIIFAGLLCFSVSAFIVSALFYTLQENTNPLSASFSLRVMGVSYWMLVFSIVPFSVSVLVLWLVS